MKDGRSAIFSREKTAFMPNVGVLLSKQELICWYLEQIMNHTIKSFMLDEEANDVIQTSITCFYSVESGP